MPKGMGYGTKAKTLPKKSKAKKKLRGLVAATGLGNPKKKGTGKAPSMGSAAGALKKMKARRQKALDF